MWDDVMSNLSEKDIIKIAKLARIAVTPEEVKVYSSELSKILAFVETLQEVDTDNVPLMTSVVDMNLPMRQDKVDDGNYREEILKNAPASDYGCFMVPKVIE